MIAFFVFLFFVSWVLPGLKLLVILARVVRVYVCVSVCVCVVCVCVCVCVWVCERERE